MATQQKTDFEAALKQILASSKMIFRNDYQRQHNASRKLFEKANPDDCESFKKIILQHFVQHRTDTTSLPNIAVVIRAYVNHEAKTINPFNSLCHFIQEIEHTLIDQHNNLDQFQQQFICELLTEMLEKVSMSSLQRIYLVGWIGKILQNGTDDDQWHFHPTLIIHLRKSLPQIIERKAEAALREHPYKLWE